MPHKCVKCGREFEDGSTDILKGCPSCSGKKFLYVREEERHADVLEEKPLESLIEEKKEGVLEVKPPKEQAPEYYERIESIRILGPGRYELNIEKLAKSDEMVLGIGKEGKYVVDIPSMARSSAKKSKSKKKKRKK
ncbi:MAG: Zn-ribbon domain-containing protein [Methanomicrobiales archaeon]|nr:Zn-ribbon domain-containing protein [Methanomicrobiales archaeon]